MKKILTAIALTFALSGCVATVGYPDVEVAYEPDVIVGPYYVGYYNPGYGYWTGYGWDVNFYAYGHRGYGHYYRGAPGYARGYYHGGGYHGGYHHH